MPSRLAKQWSEQICYFLRRHEEDELPDFLDQLIKEAFQRFKEGEPDESDYNDY